MKKQSTVAIPTSWEWSTIGEVVQERVEQSGPGTPESFVYVDIGSIDTRSKRIVEPKILGGAEAPSRARQNIQPHDVLVSMTRPNLNAVTIVPEDFHRAIGSTGFDVLRTREIEPRWLFYLVQTSAFVESMSMLVQGALYPAIRPKDVRGYRIPIAPIQEQRRIVAEIEKEFTRLDAALAAISRVQANLKQYRTSVLKAACEGRLLPSEAELARREGRSYEPASAYLARLHVERFTLKGVQRELIDSHQVSTNKLPEIPEGWVWTTLDDLLISIQAGKSFKCEERPPNHNETGVVKVSAVTWGEFDEKESKTCVEPERINENYIITTGDFLFSRANTIQLVGACVIVKNINSRLMLSDKILRFKLVSIPKEWILYFLRSQFGRSEIERLSTGNQESMRNIGQERIRSICIALPPLAEILNISADLERRLSIVDEIESQAEVDIRRAERLRQSILNTAFEGKLVPQDPRDEPASELLKRTKSIIESERGSRRDRLGTRGERLVMSRNRKTKRRPIVEVLQKARAGMSPEALFVAAGYESESVDEFFIELKAQMEAGTLWEKREGDKVTLRVK